MATSRLLALPHDGQRAIFDLLGDGLDPTVALTLSACCTELRAVSSPAREELRRLHGATRRLCARVRTSCVLVSEAQELLWYGQGLDATHLATLARLALTNALPRLEVLHLGVNRFGPEGMRALCDELGHGCLPRLRVFDLTGNAIGAAGAAALAAALSRGALPQLKVLKLGRNGVGDEGLVALARPLRRLAALQELYLFSNQIGDRGVRALLADVDEHDLAHLVTLNLVGNQIADAVRAHPNPYIQ
jgi:hypothetical protein